LAVPFVLHSQPSAAYNANKDKVDEMANVVRRRYAEIMRDVEGLVQDHSMAGYLNPLLLMI
jgi:IMP and pyridine-specific 5'-nucleotidase